MAQKNMQPNRRQDESNQACLNCRDAKEKDAVNQKEVNQTAGRTALGEFAPEFAHLNDDVLFGEVWNRQDELSLHDRSLTTILSLVSQGIIDSSLKYHLQTAKANGVTRQELSEIITHAAFYIGWPKAWGVFNLAKEMLTSTDQTVTQIAYKLGFEYSQHFNRYFKKMTGMPPTQYRQQHTA